MSKIKILSLCAILFLPVLSTAETSRENRISYLEMRIQSLEKAKECIRTEEKKNFHKCYEIIRNEKVKYKTNDNQE